jgi:predicted Rossmann fold nucleotide-binding protein DprA/Smf involved in DNA uptake
VQTLVAELIKRGDGIVSGGALGVDQLATEQALTYNPDADRIKIIILYLETIRD